MALGNLSMELVLRSDTRQRKQRFTSKSFAHPAKMVLPLQFWLIEHYSKPGDWILDPMAGSGTLLVACSLSRHVILVELESKYVSMARENWKRIQQVGPEMLHMMGEARIKQGDARNLEGILVDYIITSPPYSEGVSAHQQMQGEIIKGYFKEIITKQKEPMKTYQHRQLPEDPDNIANLPYGNVSVIFTSPPYSENPGTPSLGSVNKDDWGKQGGDIVKRRGLERGYSPSPANIGNLPHGDIDVVISSPPYEASLEASSRHLKGGIPGRDKVLGQTGTYGSLEDAEIVARKISRGFQSDKAILKIAGSARGYAHNPNNIGNLQSQTYLGEMAKVYAQCYAVLKDGGIMCLVIKPFIRNRKVIHLENDTQRLCEEVGFQFQEMHYRKLTQQSFWRTIYHKRYPDVERLDKEYILVFRKRVGAIALPMEV